ncbi:MAG: hypothetical protein KBD78_08245 [Oligoflexales bacterium]|nr:hypothetical protein [Oligoflexales bacterium]
MSCITPASIQSTLLRKDSYLSIETLDLFSQRIPNKRLSENGIDWRGDWLFRRERLKLLDSLFYSRLSNIIFLQGVLEKKGDPHDQDLKVLTDGALRDYRWESQVFQFYEDTWEEESLAVGVSFPLKLIEPAEDEKSENTNEEAQTLAERLVLEPEFAIYFVKVDYDGEDLLLINIKFRPEMADKNLNSYSRYIDSNRIYSKVIASLKSIISKAAVCDKRIVVAGYLPHALQNQEFLASLAEIGLKSTHEIFCPVLSECFTQKIDNQIFAQSTLEKNEQLADLILVPVDANVHLALRGNTEAAVSSIYTKQSYDITKIPASIRDAWVTRVEIKSCKS